MSELSNGASGDGRAANVRTCGALSALIIAMGALVLALGALARSPGRIAQPAAMSDAEALLQRERLADERADFDGAAQVLNQHNRRFREATQGAVRALLQLKDWDGALNRAAGLIPKREADQDDRRSRWRSNDDPQEKRKRQVELLRLEFIRELFDEIDTASQAADGDFPNRLSTARMSLDRQLVQTLDPPREESLFGWDSALPDVDWWWEAVPEAEEYINSDARYSRYGWRVGIALTHDDQPVFLEPPPAYSPELPRSKKLLFLLAEVERLDRSTKRNAAAEALLTRARLMRRLYGPQTDVDWRSTEFYYRYDKRPTFSPSHSPTGLKETWELADDETRTNIGERSRLIELPESQSPLALLKRLERDYPQSDSVAEALHERGLYYQSRLQFAQALDEYRREIKQFPNHPLAKKATAQIGRIEHADVILGQTGIYASGLSPKLWFACRNADRVEFTAHRFDFDAWSKDKGNEDFVGMRHPRFDRFFRDDDDDEVKKLNKFVGQEVARWTQPVDQSDRVASHSTAAPLTEAGVYSVEAQVPGSDQRSRGIVVVTGIAIVQKSLIDRVLMWVVDPSSGKPLANQKVRVVERQWSNRGTTRDTTVISDASGIAEYRHVDDEQHHYDGFIFASAEGRGIAFCDLARQADDDRDRRDLQLLALTDRPVYRPGSTVNFRIWARDLVDRTYSAAEAGIKLQVAVRGPHYATIRNMTLETDDSGSVTGSFILGSETPLGAYEFVVHAPGHGRGDDAGQFRVEEYKAPEFEVTVSPAKNATRPGEPISARVEARYYFGAPVAEGEVTYRIFRQAEKPAHSMPAEFDWLYGAGYGTRSTAQQHEEEDDLYAGSSQRYRWWSRHRGEAPGRESVEEGRVRLDADGQAEIRFDPSALKLKPSRERDWRYTIEVQVRDEGRRTVEATGSVLAPRQEFHAFAELDRGWYAPGDPVTFEINARSPNDVPVAATGNVVLCRLEETAPNAPPGVEQIQDWSVAAGADGRDTLKLTAPRAGRYRIEFRTRDSWDRDVTAAVEFWVVDPTADFSRSPRPALQIIPDRRTYRVGETARLLVVAASAEAQVLFCQTPNEHRLLSLSKHVQIVEVPITEQSVPHLFLEGTLVRAGIVHTETCQLFVPPVRDLLKVELSSDKPVQKPGESGRFKLKVTDAEGRPVSGDLALTAFDKAVTYIQPDSAIGPKSLVVARKSNVWRLALGVTATLDPRRFGTSGSFMCPEYYLTDDYVPQIGAMGGSAPHGGDPGDADGSARDVRDGLEHVPFPSTEAGPKVRSDFSDTALWQPHLKLDENGVGETNINFPQSLTTWRIRGYLVTKETRVGDLAHDVVTSKNLLVRLQRPRFLVERDEVVLSAIVHNNLKSDKTVTADLVVSAAVFRAGDDSVTGTPDADGNLLLTAKAKVSAGGQHRFDWTLTVIADGLATVTVRALTDEESDAMRTAIPVREHGTRSIVVQNGAFRSGETGEKTLVFDVPEDADPRRTRIAVSLSPTPASAAFEAIPFLAGYPYGCVEQTMSRFYPTVLAARTLKQQGLDVAQLVERSRRKQAPVKGRPSPAQFLDAAELERMTEAGLQRLQRFQHGDGGWGWWEHDQSSSYMTAYVLMGLHVAAESGVKVDEHAYDRGLIFLAKLDEPKLPAAVEHSPASTQHTAMLVAYALAMPRPKTFERRLDSNLRNRIENVLAPQLDSIYQKREQLTLYDRLLLALSQQHRSPYGRARIVLDDVLKSIELDDELDTAHLPVSAPQYWHSWNSEIETNAWLLRALVALDRENPVVPKLVNWLVLNRKQGRSWRSTQETALAVTAISEYMAALKAVAGDHTVDLRLDKGPPTTVRIASSDIMGIETVLNLPGDKPLTPGRHVVTVERAGTGTLHFALQAELLRKVAMGETHGNGLAIARRYFKLGSAPSDTTVGAGKTIRSDHKAVGTHPARQPLAMDDTLAVGDLVEVELTIKSDEDYEYVAFEDPKPAGCEAVQIRSGQTGDSGLWANVELRDDRVVFFAGHLRKGAHILRYKLRAETPGRFHALPARGFAMYAPEIHAQSDELRLRVHD